VSTFFLTCFAIGAAVLVLQFILGVVGAESDHGSGIDHHDVHGLDLLSIRALSAAAAFFGLVGFSVLRGGLGLIVALTLALVSGFGAALGIATLMRSLRRLEVDKSFDITRALGLQGQVYLGIPAHREGAGKVHLKMHDRLVELAAVTTDDAIPTGTDVLVVDTHSSDTIVVTRAQPLLRDISDVE
jgi:hypothetical protein